MSVDRCRSMQIESNSIKFTQKNNLSNFENSQNSGFWGAYPSFIWERSTTDPARKRVFRRWLLPLTMNKNLRFSNVSTCWSPCKKSGVSDLDACFDQNYLQSMKSWYLPGVVVPMLWVRYPPYFLPKTKLKLEINTFFRQTHISLLVETLYVVHIYSVTRAARAARGKFFGVFFRS